MNPGKFKRKFAYRNVLANKKTSSVIVLTLSLVFCLLMLLFGMKPTFMKLYELQAKDQYQQIDIVLTYDEYSSSRLINKRNIETTYQDEVFYAMSLFTLDVLTESEDVYYAKMMAALPHEFEYLVDQDVLTRANEVIITKSFAKTYDLNIGDSLSFSLLNETLVYSIGDIFEDEGIFEGTTFYVNKEEILERVYGLNLTNFGNTVYLDVTDGTDIDALITSLSQDEDYEGYHIFPTIDWEYIETRAADLVSIMLALGLIVFFAVLLVLDSLFPVVGRDVRQHLGVVKTLGGDKRFVLEVHLLQWGIYMIVSSLIGMLLTLLISNLGLSVYGIKGFLPLFFVPTALAFLLVLVFVMFRAVITYQRETKESVIALSTNRRYKRYQKKVYIVIIAMVLMLIELVFSFLPLAYHALVVVLLSIFVAFNLSSYVLIILSSWFKKRKKKTLFNVFQVKYLKVNKHIHQSLRVLMISLISVVLIFSVRTFMYHEIDRFSDLMRFDFALANVYDYEDQLKTDITNQYNVSDIDEAIFYQNIEIHLTEEDTQPSKFFISMDYSRYQTYFDLEAISFDDAYLSNEEAFVLLPKSYELIYDLEIGDVVTLDLNYELTGIEMVVAGYLDINVENIVYSNILDVEAFQETALANTVFINTPEKVTTYNGLIQNYSASMYYVLDSDVYFAGFINDLENITDYFTIVTAFMILCFLIVIFNNTLLVYNELKNDFAKIKVLGAGPKTFVLSFSREIFLIMTAIIVIGFAEIILLSNKLKYVVLFTNFYKDIGSSLLNNLIGYSIVFIVILLSYTYLMYNIYKLDISKEIKVY